MIFGGEVRREQAQPGQVHLSEAHCVDDRGNLSRCACHQDAVVGGTLGEPQLPKAEGEHRSERPFEVELALVDLAEVQQEVCLRAARILDELSSPGEKVRVAERAEYTLWVHHSSCLAPPFLRALRRSRMHAAIQYEREARRSGPRFWGRFPGAQNASAGRGSTGAESHGQKVSTRKSLHRSDDRCFSRRSIPRTASLSRDKLDRGVDGTGVGLFTSALRPERPPGAGRP